MRGLEFPIIGTKVPHLSKKFDLTSPGGREEYFNVKAGEEIRTIRKYLKESSFIAYLIGKKNSGKGTYAKLFSEIFGEEKVTHLSVGDLVREYSASWENFVQTSSFAKLKNLYRGYVSFDEAVKRLLNRSTQTLLPTEFVLALLKLRIGELKGKSIFIDGLPRDLDQVSYSLFFRDLAGYTDAPDFFVLIDIPESVIDERIKYRVVCPLCNTSRNTKLLITSKVSYDPKKRDFYLLCDNPDCEGARMEKKEGDELGLEPIRPRLAKDEEVLKSVFSLHGIGKILLRNHVPVSQASKYFDEYELTPEYKFSWDRKKKRVEIIEKQWTLKDDNDSPCYSLLAPPVVVSLLKQLVEVLNA
jgi:adenylate kinase family enzyme